MKIIIELDLHSRDIERLAWAISAMREEYREREKTALTANLRHVATLTITRLDMLLANLTTAWRKALKAQGVTVIHSLPPLPES